MRAHQESIVVKLQPVMYLMPRVERGLPSNSSHINREGGLVAWQVPNSQQPVDYD
jgi:hypothetical protein